MKYWLLCLLLLFSASVRAETSIVMLFGGEYPPYYTSGHEDGMYIEFISEFEKQHPQYLIEFYALSRKRIDLWMKDGTADAVALYSPDFASEQALQRFKPSIPLWRTYDIVVSKKHTPIRYINNTSLYQRKIGVIMGNHYKYLEPHFGADKIFRINSYTIKGMFDSLLAENIDGLIVNKHSAPYYMTKFKTSKNELYFDDNPLYFFNLVTMVKKEHSAFLDDLNAFIVTSRENGYFAHLEQKYGFSDVLDNKLSNQ